MSRRKIFGEFFNGYSFFFFFFTCDSRECKKYSGFCLLVIFTPVFPRPEELTYRVSSEPMRRSNFEFTKIQITDMTKKRILCISGPTGELKELW